MHSALAEAHSPVATTKDRRLRLAGTAMSAGSKPWPMAGTASGTPRRQSISTVSPTSRSIQTLPRPMYQRCCQPSLPTES